MALSKMETTLRDQLPEVRGRIAENTPLGAFSWFRVGGPAEILFKPQDIEDLQHFLKHTPIDIPITTLGVASNLIIRDGGIKGVTLRLLKEFTKIDRLDDTHIYAGAGATDISVAQMALKHNIGGLEFFSGIPGTIGGAVKMNAGAYGRETKDVLVKAICLDRSGLRHELTAQDLNMQYRHTDLPADWIVVGAVFKGEVKDAALISQEMAEIKSKRESSQPVREKTGGSTFANPLPKSSWKLIDEAGCRGLKHGGAQMSELHCNFMINTGDATAFDLEQLGETVRERVFQNAGIKLRWEIRRIGAFAADQNLKTAF